MHGFRDGAEVVAYELVEESQVKQEFVLILLGLDRVQQLRNHKLGLLLGDLQKGLLAHLVALVLHVSQLLDQGRQQVFIKRLEISLPS